eukprot:1684809-Rhodomonas_salina.3
MLTGSRAHPFFLFFRPLAAQSGPGRVAATLFVRPAPTATLRKPPSPDLAGVNVPEMKFSAWRLKTQKR